jgi:hypothetical protein
VVDNEGRATIAVVWTGEGELMVERLVIVAAGREDRPGAEEFVTEADEDDNADEVGADLAGGGCGVRVLPCAPLSRTACGAGAGLGPPALIRMREAV